jgi:hypothetical protein
MASGVPLKQSITSGFPVVGCTAGGAAIAKLKLNKVTIPMKRHFLANIFVPPNNSFGVTLLQNTQFYVE